MHPAVLLGLLGAAAVVSSVPVNNGNHNEEMVTRCIIEVLSSALSKSGAPPITPECRQILKKSGKEVKDEEKSGNENTRFEVRLLRDQTDASEAHGPPGREGVETSKKENPQDSAVATETEGGGHSHEGAGKPQESLPSVSNSHVSKEAKAQHSDLSSEEKQVKEEKQLKGARVEDASEELHIEEPLETHNTFLHTRNQATSNDREDSVSPYGDTYGAQTGERLEGKTHSRERSSQESGEDKGSFEKYPHTSESQLESQQESKESVEEASPEVDKRLLKHHHSRTRPDRSSQEWNLENKGKDHPEEAFEESNAAWASLGNRQDYPPSPNRAFQQESEYGGRVRSSPAVQLPARMEGGYHRSRGSDEYRAPSPPIEEIQEEEVQRNYYSPELDYISPEYSEEGKEEKGWEWGPSPKAKSGETGASNKEDKRFLGESYHQVGVNPMDKARRYPQVEWDEQNRNNLKYGEGRGEEGVYGRWQQPEYLQESRPKEEAQLLGQRSTPHHISDESKRLRELLDSYYHPTQWKSNHYERKDNMEDGFLEGEEDNGLALDEKNFSPDYSYDWWEKKPVEDNVNWGYEKRNMGPKLDSKRQYDRVAELDQLLHYRKKAAEFPDFYDSEEPMNVHQAAEIEGERAGQGILTEEEKKELENLAAMDLELQKIAEKFSGNRGG